MKAVVSRVGTTTLHIDQLVHAQISHGLLVHICLEPQDTGASILPFIETLQTLQLFADSQGRMELTVSDVGGSIMVVPQFTLTATFTRGRPSFGGVMQATQAKQLFSTLVSAWSSQPKPPVVAGVFGANMQITAVQDGPVTVLFEW